MGYDDQFQKQIGGELAEQQRAVQGAVQLATLLCTFRNTLRLGGLDDAEATEWAHEYFEMLLTARAALDTFEDEDDDD